MRFDSRQMYKASGYHLRIIFLLSLLGGCVPQKERHIERLSSEEYLLKGTAAALDFWESLLMEDDKGDSTADHLAEVIAELLKGELSGVISPTPGFILERIRGEAAVNNQALDNMISFTGEWQGKWGAMPVHHRWHPIQRHVRDIPVTAHFDGYAIAASQYAWIGDGFGWNLEVTDYARHHRLLLGSVYHLDELQQVSYHVPHVGVAGAPGLVVWIVPGRLYFERTVAEGEKYLIAEYRWQRQGKAIEYSKGQCAIYSRPGSFTNI